MTQDVIGDLTPAWLNRQPRSRQVGIASLLVVILLLGLFSLTGPVDIYAVKVNGQTVAFVQNKAELQNVIANLLKDKSKGIAGHLKIKDNIRLVKENARRSQIFTPDMLQNKLASILTFEEDGTGIKINGTVRVVVKDKTTAERVLDKIKRTYQVDRGATVNFKEKVDLVDLPAKDGQIADFDKAYNLLNPAGKRQALLSVVETYTKSVQEVVPTPVQVKKDNNMPIGQSKVIQNGQPGLREVTYRVVKVNGQLALKQALVQEVLKSPTVQVVDKGARLMMASRGNIGRPAGPITSPFGMRNGRMHTGVDIGLPYGAPVMAVRGGTIIRASYFSGYGNCIDIDHGNGIVTRYAHLSVMKVSVGDQVGAGQVIGLVGATGDATGPHLHFEVIINGVQVNPIGNL